MDQPKNPVMLAVIGAAHGIKGELRVKTFTGDPLALADYGLLFDRDGNSYEVESIRPQQEVVVVRLKGISDRTQAERLNGTELFVDRSRLPPAEDGEFYHDDLVGLNVRDESGATIGKVTAVQNFGGGDVLELRVHGRKGVLIPFTHAAVPEIAVADGYLKVDTVAAGLIDTDESEPGDDLQSLKVRRRNRGPKEAGGNR
ncbi:MAG: ribosome maturation factor RimM [Rhizobiaceae bacterium]|nr:ribosome maturation factor RimM [Rhizobiaceae bacterium]